MHVLHIVGARPNFMKMAPLVDALKKRGHIRQTLVHTGQHYNANMSEIFFHQLQIPEPDIDLGVGSGSHAQQTAQIMSRFEPVLLTQKPNLVLVYGDVNSTVAAALVCAKINIPVGHVEAGLRSFDRTMPEEINRILTDQVAELLFTPSVDGNENLIREGVSSEKIYLVGNIMIDTLMRLLPKADYNTLGGLDFINNGSIHITKQKKDPYILITLHRPSNVDNPHMLAKIMDTLHEISQKIPIIFPVHPRTYQRFQDLNLKIDNKSLYLIEPIGYLQFLALQRSATIVITDSGGIQEETTFLGVPCVTVRENTERPVTITAGTNVLVNNDMEKLKKEVDKILTGFIKKGTVPILWDGKTSERIATVLDKWWSRIH